MRLGTDYGTDPPFPGRPGKPQAAPGVAGGPLPGGSGGQGRVPNAALRPGHRGFLTPEQDARPLEGPEAGGRTGAVSRAPGSVAPGAGTGCGGGGAGGG